MQRALFQHVALGVPLIKALVENGALGLRPIEEELARTDAPTVRAVVPITRLVEALPADLCRALLALPVRQDPFTGTVDVATLDPQNLHVEREFAYHLRAPIRLIRAPLAALEEAFRKLDASPAEPPKLLAQIRPGRKTPPYINRADIEAVASTVPQLRAPSDRPIPLVRRADGPPGPPHNTQRPPPSQGPFSSTAPQGPFPDPTPTIEALRQATSRDQIIELLLRGLSAVASRVGALAVRKTEFQGWRCTASLAAPDIFRELRVPSDVPSVFATALATGCYLGPVPVNTTHSSLLDAMGGLADEIAIVPVRVEGKPALLLLLGDLGDSMLATRRAEELGRVAGEALGRLVRG